MTTTQAIVARQPVEAGRVNWKLEDVVIDEPGDGEVLVEMCASGLCHTDIVLSVMPVGFPKVVGHEGRAYAVSNSTERKYIGIIADCYLQVPGMFALLEKG
jgi:Zn-dependent alcohol dehydrogenase